MVNERANNRYTQGLNRLAAVALLFTNEEDAFWTLVAIIECILPNGYYSETLIASQVRLHVELKISYITSNKIMKLGLTLLGCFLPKA